MAKLIPIAEATGEKRASAIFVHGLTGDPLETWTSPPPESAVWPKWLAEDLKGLAVFSVGYDAPVRDSDHATMHPVDIASNVLNGLLAEPPLKEGQIILIGHSLGGLVIKMMLRRAAAEAPSFMDRVRKVAFLATPHSGADLAALGDLLRVLVRPSPAALSLVHNDPNLRELNEEYRVLARNKIVHLTLIETIPLIYAYRTPLGITVRKDLGIIVKPDSGDPGVEANPIQIQGADHIAIAKPVNRDDDIYKLIRAFIKRPVERWVSPEEGKIDAVKEDTQAIRENVERLTGELSMSNAQREVLVGELAKVKADFGGTVNLVSGFLERIVDRKVAPEQFAATLFKIAGDWKSAGEKIDALSYSGNLSPHLSVLRDQAKTAHEAGRLDEAEKLLGEIARDEIDALKRLEDHDREVQEEIQLRKRGVADTKAAHAAVAHARLNYRDAAALYGEAASLVASFDPERRGRLLFSQAGELYAQGEEFGDNAALSEAIELYGLCLAQTPPARAPLDWATTQNNLGLALFRLGERESGTARLEEAVAAYREALKESTRARVPLDWAKTQMNLGGALFRLGERESGTARLDEAIVAYHEALQENTRERVPLDWAMAQMNLGVALKVLGERESGTARLEEAVAAYREALQELTRARAPLQWAETQMNLGFALFRLGERESGTARLTEAVFAFREALQEWTRARVPLNWAGT